VAKLLLIPKPDGLDAAALRDAFAQRPLQLILAKFAERRDVLLGQIRNAKDWSDYVAIQARLAEIEGALETPAALIRQAAERAEREPSKRPPRGERLPGE
jgi:hypothetical protein